MAITSSSPWNKSYCRLTGTFSGTIETHFQIVITEQDGSKFKHRKKTLGEWSSYTTNVSLTVNTDISLSDGMSVKFTRSNAATYATGDSWKFLVAPDLLLDDNQASYTPGSIEDPYDTLEMIQNGDQQDLIALSSKNGKIAVIKNYESSEPEIYNNLSTSLASNSEGYSTVRKNKELYVATGKENHPQWIGYNKNDGFSGSTENFNFVKESAYEQIDSSNPIDDIMHEGVILQCGGSNTLNARIMVGYKENDTTLYVQNIAENKLYTFNCGGQPLQIRENPAQMDSNNDCNGFAVLVQSGIHNATRSLELWEVPITGTASLIGQSTNRKKVIHLQKPEQYEGPNDSNDFLIVSSNANPWTSGTDFTLWVSMWSDGSTGGNSENMLFKYDDIDDEADDAVISSSSWINCSPKLGGNGAGTDRTSSELKDRFLKRVYEDNGNPTDGPDIWQGWEQASQSYTMVQKTNLMLIGYDTNGTNPQIGFTARLRGIQNSGQNAYWTHKGSGVFNDGSKLWVLNWVTFMVGNSATGKNYCRMLGHFSDWGIANPDTRWQSYFNANVGAEEALEDNSTMNQTHIVSNLAKSTDYTYQQTMMPHPCPMFAAGSGVNDGRKVNCVVDASTGVRDGMNYIRTSNTSPRMWYFKRRYYTGEHPWDNFLNMFPNTYSNMHTAFSAGSTNVNEPHDVSTNGTSEKRYAILPVDSESGDSARYRMLSRTHLYTMDTYQSVVNGIPETTEGFWCTQPMDSYTSGGTTERLIKSHLNSNQSNPTNVFGSSLPWFSFESIQEDTSIEWIGLTTKKAFYKIALLYDGYQESTLMSATGLHDSSSDFTKGVSLTLRIQADFALSSRINAVVVYRATDSSQTADEPENLYRFVEEVPLYKFNYDESNNRREYTVKDNGNQDASYEALNGISETLSNLTIKYGVNTEVNGFHFVGDCKHSQFDDAENVIFRSQPGKYSIFDWSKDFLTINFKPKAMVGYLGKLYVFGSERMCIINLQALIIEDEIQGIGICSKKSYKVTPSGLYWFDNTNIYNSTPKINKIGTSIQTVETYGWTNLSSAVKNDAVIAYDTIRQAVLVFFTTEADTPENRCWAFSSAQRRWDLWESGYKVYDSVDSPDGHPILLLSNGRICKYSSGSNNKNWQWESKKMSFGNDTIFKKIRVLKLDSTSRNSVTVQYKADTAESSWEDGTDISNNYGTSWKGKAKRIASNHSKLKWFKARVTGTNTLTGSNHKGHSIGVIYKPKKPK